MRTFALDELSILLHKLTYKSGSLMGKVIAVTRTNFARVNFNELDQWAHLWTTCLVYWP
jgi:hypothetical protein